MDKISTDRTARASIGFARAVAARTELGQQDRLRQIDMLVDLASGFDCAAAEAAALAWFNEGPETEAVGDVFVAEYVLRRVQVHNYL
jgi:hypothetical protein